MIVISTCIQALDELRHMCMRVQSIRNSLLFDVVRFGTLFDLSKGFRSKSAGSEMIPSERIHQYFYFSLARKKD
jgi:hypothetical protein